MTTVKPIPDGYTTVTPHLVLSDATKAIEFYKTAFGAKELARMTAPDGKSIIHAEIQIGNAIVMICDEFPEMGCLSPEKIGGSSTSLFLYVEDVDATYKKALEAGCKELMPVADMFWGDRYGQVQDPYGHRWAIATHIKDVTPEEMQEAAKKLFSKKE